MHRLPAFGALALLLAGCPGVLGPDLVTGERTPFAGGEAWTTLGTEDDLDGPLSFGIQMDVDLDAMPGDSRTVVLPMPFGAGALVPFNHVELNWLPDGHEPEDVFGVPHFEVKFSLLTQQERAQIAAGDCQGYPVTCTALDRALIPLPFEAQPPFHEATDLVLPFAGRYLLDMRGPEWNDAELERALTYTAFDGQIAAIAPMVSSSFLQGLVGRSCRSIDAPPTFAAAGFYPTEYCVGLEDGLYSIELTSWELFGATQADLPDVEDDD